MDAPENILYVASSRSISASAPGRKITSICRTWRDAGHRVELVGGADAFGPGVPEGRGPLRDQLVSAPVNEGLHMPLVHSVSEIRDLLHDRRLERLLRARARANPPGLVWHRASRLHMAPLKLSRSLGVPYVLEWIDLDFYEISLLRWKTRRADRRRLEHADRVVIISERWKRDVVEHFSVDPEKFLVVPNAVEPEAFRRDPAAGREIRARMGIPAQAFVVGYVGTYAFYHEAHLLPKAAAQVRRLHDGPICWLLVGQGGKQAEVERLVDELGVGDVMMRHGRVSGDEVPRWLSAMDTAVLPGSAEIICPIKVQEYMAASLAPIVPDTEVNREVVTQGRTGRLFAPLDASALAEQVVALARDPRGARALGEAALREAQERFTWPRTWGRALETILKHS